MPSYKTREYRKIRISCYVATPTSQKEILAAMNEMRVRRVEFWGDKNVGHPSRIFFDASDEEIHMWTDVETEMGRS